MFKGKGFFGKLSDFVIDTASEIISNTLDDIENNYNDKVDTDEPITDTEKAIREIIHPFTHARNKLNSKNLIQKNALKVILECENDLYNEAKELFEKLSWKPCIFFYGMTNAGKSTLIEALRLLFNDKLDCEGGSIGDGRQDFTQEVTSHLLKIEDKEVTLLDLPGIEGKEETVINAINDGLAKSHVVFYITADPRAPQESTAKKINKQLKEQAEVFGIFNKQILQDYKYSLDNLQPSPSSDIYKSLHDENNPSFDSILKKELNNHYKGSIVISARPAFLALANNLQKETDKDDQKYLLEEISRDDAIEASNIEEVADYIYNNIPTFDKIVSSNKSKFETLINQKLVKINAYDETLSKENDNLTKVVNEFNKGINDLIIDVTQDLKNIGADCAKEEIIRIRNQAISQVNAPIHKDDYTSLNEGEDYSNNPNATFIHENNFKDFIIHKIKDGVKDLHKNILKKLTQYNESELSLKIENKFKDILGLIKYRTDNANILDISTIKSSLKDVDISMDFESPKYQEVGLGGTFGAALTGATIGSIIPGLGTAIGGTIGGIVGAIWKFSSDEDKAAEQNMINRKNTASKAIDNFAPYLTKSVEDNMTDIAQLLGKEIKDRVLNSLNQQLKNIENTKTTLHYLLEQANNF